MIKELTRQIEKVEGDPDNIIKNDDYLKKLYELIISIKGVGPQTAMFMIAFTDSFTRFENRRKFASYCGTAHFPNSSGISIRGKN